MGISYHRRRWVIPLAFGVVPLVVAWVLWGTLTYDDAYITLTYAKNLAAGKGFVYNGGEPYLGTTTPLLALLLGGLGALFPAIGVDGWALWVGALAWLGAIWVAFVLGERIVAGWGGVFAALVMATAPTFPHVLRAEFPLLMLLGLTGVLLAIHRRYGLAGAVFGLAFLARGDALILAGVAGLAALWRERRLPWRMVGGFLLVFIPWAIYAYLTFGSPLPATLGVKRAHRALGAWPHITFGFWTWLVHSPPALQVRFWTSVVGAGIGLVLFVRERRVWGLVILAWGVLYALGYLLLNVPFYAWYATTLLISLALGAGLGLARLGMDAHRGKKMLAWGLITLLLISGAWAMVAKTHRIKTWRNPKIEAYLAAADWLKTHTPEDTTVGFIEVGTIAYFSDRQIIDLLGLVTPGAEPFLKARDNAGLFKSLHPEYYIRNCHFDAWGMNRRVHESPFFQENYAPVAAFPQGETDRPPVIIYRRIDVPGPPFDPRLDAPCQSSS